MDPMLDLWAEVESTPSPSDLRGTSTAQPDTDVLGAIEELFDEAYSSVETEIDEFNIPTADGHSTLVLLSRHCGTSRNTRLFAFEPTPTGDQSQTALGRDGTASSQFRNLRG